jgi:sulfide:quinone oxidoreductase
MKVLIAGGGVAALEAALALRALAAEQVTVELLAPATEFAFRAHSVRSPFDGEPAPRIAFPPVKLHRGSLAAVQPDRHEVRTTDGGTLAYDRLLVAVGARQVEAVHGATHFRGPVSAGAVEHALQAERVVFTLPARPLWTLPLYELALLAGRPSVLVTPEPRPLDIFGRTASDAVARLLDRAGVEFRGSTAGSAVLGGALLTSRGELIPADAVIALPQHEPRTIPGLPEGFLEIDEHARVIGVPDVFAAGDITEGAIKQGGLATQQADAAAEWIAAEVGARVEPRPYRPVLRGLLLTGDAPLYLRTELTGERGFARPLRAGRPQVSRAPLWWPDAKVAGRYLTGYVAADRGARASGPIKQTQSGGLQ